MPIGKRPHSTAVMIRIVYLLICFLPLTDAASGQTTLSKPDKLAYAVDPANLPDAIAKVKSGEFANVHLEMIARAHAVEASAALKEQFASAQDPLIKAHIASVLVRLGEQDDAYWNFLVSLASPEIEGDVPDMFSYDAQGKLDMAAGPPHEFVAWAKGHSVSLEKDPIEVMGSIVGPVEYLAMTGDPRGIPLLRRALLSPNHMIEYQAARGLAEVHDTASIPLIIEACKSAPSEAASSLATSLVYFDDPEAQTAVDTYVPKDTAKIYRDARAAGKTPFR